MVTFCLENGATLNFKDPRTDVIIIFIIHNINNY